MMSKIIQMTKIFIFHGVLYHILYFAMEKLKRIVLDLMTDDDLTLTLNA